MGNITRQEVRTVYNAIIEGLEVEKINEEITDLTWIDIMSIIITVNMIVHILS